MKTDRELLELAARAIGLTITWENGQEYAEIITPFRGHLMNYEPWNPLTDDGDAFRLKVKSRVANHLIAHHWAKCSIFMLNKDEMAAERRAIVCAVAEAQEEKESE